MFLTSSQAMTTFQLPANEGALPEIPNVSIPQFIFDTDLAVRPTRPRETPWLIEDSTGRKIGKEEVGETFVILLCALKDSYSFAHARPDWQMLFPFVIIFVSSNCSLRYYSAC